MAEKQTGWGVRASSYWDAVMSEFDLTEDEDQIFTELVGCLDQCDRLAGVLSAEGLLPAGKAHPAVAMLRAERLLLARLGTQLGLEWPEGEPVESLTSRRARHAANSRWARTEEARASRKVR